MFPNSKNELRTKSDHCLCGDAAREETLFLELDFARGLGECARSTETSSYKVATAAALDVITRTGFFSSTHLDKAWAATVRQGRVYHAIAVAHVSTSGVCTSLGL